MARYGKKAASKVAKALHEKKHGTLKSCRSGKTVKSRKQAIAIGLSEACKAGGKVPKKAAKKAARKAPKTPSGRAPAKKTAGRKTPRQKK